MTGLLVMKLQTLAVQNNTSQVSGVASEVVVVVAALVSRDSAGKPLAVSINPHLRAPCLASSRLANNCNAIQQKLAGWKYLM